MSKIDDREKFWQRIGEAFRELSPEAVVRDADRPISLALVAEERDELRRMEEFFVPRLLGSSKAAQVRERICSFVLPLTRLEQEGLRQLDLVICSQAGMRDLLPRTYIFHEENPQAVVKEILKERWDLALPLAGNFLAFRRAVGRRATRSAALENALFAMMTALPDVVRAPSPMSRAARGLASSTVFLTANQMRLAFLIAAANDSKVGFREQTGQITAIVAAAFGWRLLGRELAGKISPAKGLLAKGLLAFGATYATGLALEQLHSLGRSMTREEKARAYEEAYRVGRRVLDGILDTMGSRSRSGSSSISSRGTEPQKF